MDVVQRLLADRPSFHLGGTVNWDSTPGTLRCLQSRSSAGDRTVETGCGASTVVFAAASTRHTVISPDPSEHELVREYCASIGVDCSGVEFIADSSDVVLPAMFRGRVVDGVFIDGAHEFPYPVIDWHYLSRALKVGGWLLVDDIPIPAVAVTNRHMRGDSHWVIESILDDRAGFYRLIAEPPASESYRAQAFNRWPDYSYAALPHRIRLSADAEIGRVRVRLARRYPQLRQTWKALTGTRTKG